MTPLIWIKLKATNSFINSCSPKKGAELLVDLSKKQFKNGYVENIKKVREFLALLNWELGKLI